jgi:ribonuclease HI
MNAFDVLMKQNEVAPATETNTTPSGFQLIKRGSPPEENYYLLQFDGLSVPNPGASTSGAVIFSPGSPRKVLAEKAHFIKHATNNEAEYGGLILGLELAKQLKIENLLIEGDSQLVIYQTEKRWKAKDLRMAKLQEIVQELLKSFNFIGIRHVRREFNTHADALTNECIKSRESFERFHTKL